MRILFKVKEREFEKRNVFRYMSIAEISRSEEFGQKSSFFDSPISENTVKITLEPAQ